MKVSFLAASFAAATAHAMDVTGPCDIYDAAGTPCVAAHSLVRALYGSYDGPLYMIQRASDNATMNISVLEAGGQVEADAQDTFCGSSECTIERIFDQSPKGNHLDVAPAGKQIFRRGADKGCKAMRSKLLINGHPAYGAYFEGHMGYRNDKTSGIATGDEPESMYMVAAGKHYNGLCCFDYGNAETDTKDDGKGTMEAIYWGSSWFWGRGGGKGPWVMADLEDGLWAGHEKVSPANTPIAADFVTAMVKGKVGGFAVKGGDAQAGPLKKMYEGSRPNGYSTMKKQGAIILGVGGDNSPWAVGTFYEGVMTAGYSSDAIDDAIQANIVAAGFGRPSSVVFT